MITWVLYLCIGIVIGGMAGFYFAKLDDFSKKQKRELEDKLHQSEQELVEYKDQVTAHFRETATLINNMTDSYQKVHEHLANGSVELCNNAIEVNKLTVSSEKLPPSAPQGISPNAEEVTSQAESEAPKTSSIDNNNNKPENEAARIPDVDSPESLAANSISTDATSPDDSTQLENQQNQSGKTADSTSITENPVLETMAVAEEEPITEEQQEENANNPVPGSRMVH